MKCNPEYSSKEALLSLYQKPLLELVFEAATIHRKYHNSREVQMSSLLSIKTGGCPEDCGYCPQAARYHTDVDAHKLMNVDEVLNQAKNAKANGSSRLCMGAAWREIRDNKDFDKVVEMVQGVNEMGMEVCCTLGMMSEGQAKRLKNAGLFAYNHNLDSSKEFYSDVISTREYEQRCRVCVESSWRKCSRSRMESDLSKNCYLCKESVSRSSTLSKRYSCEVSNKDID